MTPERFLELESARTRARLAGSVRGAGRSVEHGLGAGDWIRRHPLLTLGAGTLVGLSFGRLAGPSGVVGLGLALGRFGLRRGLAIFRAVGRAAVLGEPGGAPPSAD